MELVKTDHTLINGKKRFNLKFISWSALGAIFGIVGAIVFPIIGAFILEQNRNGIEVNKFLLDFAFVLALSTIPLLIFGTYFLNIVIDRHLPKGIYTISKRQMIIPPKFKINPQTPRRNEDVKCNFEKKNM